MSDNTARSLLLRLGVGDFNATMVIPVMFFGPAQSDPDMTQIKVLTKAMQQTMKAMGASWLTANGQLDASTSTCLAVIGGAHWTETPWYELVQRLLEARDHGQRFTRPGPAQSIELAGVPDVSAIPGGYLTLGIGAYLVYRHFKKGR